MHTWFVYVPSDVRMKKPKSFQVNGDVNDAIKRAWQIFDFVRASNKMPLIVQGTRIWSVEAKQSYVQH